MSKTPKIESKIRRGLEKLAAERRAARISSTATAALDQALAGEKQASDRDALLRAMLKIGVERLRASAGPLEAISLLGALCHEPLELPRSRARDAAEALFLGEAPLVDGVEP